MVRVIEKNVAEIIMVGVFLIVLMSSCGGSKCIYKNSHKRAFCPAYASKETKVMTQEEYYANLDCNNCDEID